MRTVLKKAVVRVAAWSAVIAGGWFGFDVYQNHHFARAEDQRQEVRAGLEHVEGLATAFRKVGKVVEPSVVHIQVKKKIIAVKGGGGRNDGRELRERFRRLFPDQELPDEVLPFDVPDGDFDQQGQGSGVIMDAGDGKGFVLTNNHVAGGADEIVITLADGREIRNCKIIGADAKTDLAVLEIKADRLSPAKWGNSDDLQKGDIIMAFGSPFGYVGSMTHGIVSALNRQVGILAPTGGYENFIQVDAPINPGNSGGALVDLKGEVVGINTAIASQNGGFQGLGFAIPSNQAKFIYSSLRDKGKVVRGWLGVSIADVSRNQKLAEDFGYDKGTGVLVNEILAGTPAKGKLERGDIITEINSKPIENHFQLRTTIAALAPNSEVKMKVFRSGKTMDVTVKLGEQPDDIVSLRGPGRIKPVAPREEVVKEETLGLQVLSLTPEIAKKQGFDLDSGALVKSVERNSPASKEGIRPGDVITQVGSAIVKDADEFEAAIKKADMKKGVRLYVTGAEGSRFVFLSK